MDKKVTRQDLVKVKEQAAELYDDDQFESVITVFKNGLAMCELYERQHPKMMSKSDLLQTKELKES
jgi:hypothetical protein